MCSLPLRAALSALLDDASDTTQAVQDTRKLIAEKRVDAIIGSYCIGSRSSRASA